MSNDFVRFSFPNIQEMCIDISSHKLQWKLSVDFSCLDGSMPHHHLKHLLGYTLATVDCSGTKHLVQRFLLLGTLLHDWQPLEIRQCAERHEYMARLYGEHGIRI